MVVNGVVPDWAHCTGCTARKLPPNPPEVKDPVHLLDRVEGKQSPQLKEEVPLGVVMGEEIIHHPHEGLEKHPQGERAVQFEGGLLLVLQVARHS